MDWLQDMTARWTRILNSAGGGRTPVDEAVAQISAISEAPVKKGAFGRLKRNAVAPAEASAVTVLCRQLIAGVIISDLIVDQLGTLSGQSRQQVLAEAQASELVDAARAEAAEITAAARAQEPGGPSSGTANGA